MVADLGTVDMFASSGAAADLDRDGWTTSLSIMPQTVGACAVGWLVLHLMLRRSVPPKIFGITRNKDEVSVPNM